MIHSPPAPSAFPRIPGYTVTGLLGSGAFSTVYRAEDAVTGEIVAIKDFPHAEGGSRLFMNEVSSLMALQHPHVVTCRNVVYSASGHHYLIMDHAEGGSLRDLLNAREKLPVAEALEAARQITLGLAAAHEVGLIHRDVKPENVLWQDEDGTMRFRIADLGICDSLLRRAREASTGSPAYMAPEQFYDHATALSDLYSVGVILYEMITGHRPYEGMAIDLYQAHVVGGADMEGISDPEVRELIIRLMAVDLAQRPRSAWNVVGQLTRLLGNFALTGTFTLTESAPELGICAVAQERLPQISRKMLWQELMIPHLTQMAGLTTEEGPVLLLADGKSTDCFLFSQRRLITRWHNQALTAAASGGDGRHFLAMEREIWSMTSLKNAIPLFQVPLRISALALARQAEQILCADQKRVQCLDPRGRLLWTFACDNYFSHPQLLALANGDWAISSGPMNPRVFHLSATGELLRTYLFPAPVLALLPGRQGAEFQIITMGSSSEEDGRLHYAGRREELGSVSLGVGLAQADVHESFVTLFYNNARIAHIDFYGHQLGDSYADTTYEHSCYCANSGYLALAGTRGQAHHVHIYYRSPETTETVPAAASRNETAVSPHRPRADHAASGSILLEH